ncbi:MAG: hypothetical protein JW953_04445 [Anaerolineae bacterium]|nr:hypothetical protein [Anaerolineae bacterium]
MDYVDLIKRSFKITIKYRALWIFGFFLALCSATGGGGGNGGGSGGPPPGSYDGNGFEQGFDWPYESFFTSANIWLIIGGIVAAVLCLILFMAVVSAVVQAVTRAALIGMVDQVEETGGVTVKEGWRIGWSKRAWRVFLVGFIIALPLIIIFGVLLLAAVSPFFLAFLENTGLLIFGIVAGIGLLLLWILAVIIVSVVVMPFQELAWRYAVLRQKGAVESLKASYALIRQNLKDVAILVLLMIGLGIAWAMVSFVVTIVVMVLAGLVGLIPGLVVFLLTWKWWAALLAGGLVFIVLLTVSMTFVTGLYLIFRSGLWTLAFRELTVAGQMSAKPALPEETQEDTDKKSEIEQADEDTPAEGS